MQNYYLFISLCLSLLFSTCSCSQTDPSDHADVNLSEQDVEAEVVTLPPSYYSKSHYDSFSVIIPAHNTAPYVTRTLLSVEESIKTFKRTVPGGDQVHAEVVIVDDASTDNTASVVTNFIEQRKKAGVKGIHWKLVALQVNVLGGAARNFGVRESTGDILFFCDSDDLYHPSHIGYCWSHIIARDSVGMVETLAEVEVENIHPGWKKRVESSIPLNKCVKRKIHEFIEGFPEQGVFTRHQDIGYLQAMSALKIPYGRIQKETVTYKWYPGNSLDTQREKFQSDPEKKIKSDEELGDDYPVRMALILNHMVHLINKAKDFSEGKPLKENSLWAIYQHVINEMNLGSKWHTLQVRSTKYRRMLDFVEDQMRKGKKTEAQKAMRVAQKFVFDATEKQPPLFYIASSSPEDCNKAQQPQQQQQQHYGFNFPEPTRLYGEL